MNLPLLRSQDPLVWRWSAPLPHGNNIKDLAVSDSLAVQVTEAGQIYTSVDLETWRPRESGTRNALRGVTFFHDQIVISGEAGIIVRADDPAAFEIIDLATADWLEDIAASETRLVVVGDNGTIFTSEDGRTWTREDSDTSTWLRGVAYGSGQFVAVGEDGFIASSPDGTVWTPRRSGTSEHLNTVVPVPDGFVALGNTGTALSGNTSASSWAPISLGANGDLLAGATDGLTLAVAGDLELRLRRSGNWSDQLDSSLNWPAPSWEYLTGAWADSFYLMAGQTGMLVSGFPDPDGSGEYVWPEINESFRNWLWDIERFPDLYIAVGDQATVLTSLEGVDWHVEFVPEPLQSSIFLGVGGRPDLAVAAGNAGALMRSRDEPVEIVVTNEINGEVVVETNITSQLGILWEAVQPAPTLEDLQGVAAFNNRLLVSGGNGTLLISDDNGTTWEPRNTGVASFLSSIAAGPDLLVCVGTQGTLLTSPDGDQWSPISLGLTEWLYRVRYLNGTFIVTGESGTLLTSTDGSTWSPQSTPTESWLNDAEFVDGRYYSIGNQGTVLASDNLATWQPVPTITGKSLYGAATHAGKLIVTGIEGIILRTQITPITTPVSVIDYDHVTESNAVLDLFLLGGAPDQKFRLESSENLSTWQPAANLEIFDASGLLIHPLSRTNTPPTEFFRTIPVPTQ